MRPARLQCLNKLKISRSATKGPGNHYEVRGHPTVMILILTTALETGGGSFCFFFAPSTPRSLVLFLCSKGKRAIEERRRHIPGGVKTQSYIQLGCACAYSC